MLALMLPSLLTATLRTSTPGTVIYNKENANKLHNVVWDTIEKTFYLQYDNILVMSSVLLLQY